MKLLLNVLRHTINLRETPIVDDDFAEMRDKCDSAIIDARVRNIIYRDFPEVVCLCGSTKFKDDFEYIAKMMSLNGNIVLSVGFFGHMEGMPLTIEVKQRLDALHLKKIQMCDSVFVINKGGYIGDSTRNEINYAKSLNIPINYLELLA